MTEPWWRNHPGAETSIMCSGQLHTIRWHDGALVLLNHDDPEGERALTALGGDSCECVDIHGSWNRHRDDLRLLVLASRGTGDPIVQIDEQTLGFVRRTPAIQAGSSPRSFLLRGVRSGSLAYSSQARFRTGPVVLATGAPQDEALALLQLGGGLSDRLLATVLAEWTERISGDDERVAAERAALTVALYGRVTMALRSWLNEPDLAVALDMIDESDSPDLARGPDVVHARLPFRWLIDVWARGVSVVLGRFATKLLDAEENRQRVLTVSPDFGDIRPVTISIG